MDEQVTAKSGGHRCRTAPGDLFGRPGQGRPHRDDHAEPVQSALHVRQALPTDDDDGEYPGQQNCLRDHHHRRNDSQGHGNHQQGTHALGVPHQPRVQGSHQPSVTEGPDSGRRRPSQVAGPPPVIDGPLPVIDATIGSDGRGPKNPATSGPPPGLSADARPVVLSSPGRPVRHIDAVPSTRLRCPGHPGSTHNDGPFELAVVARDAFVIHAEEQRLTTSLTSGMPDEPPTSTHALTTTGVWRCAQMLSRTNPSWMIMSIWAPGRCWRSSWRYEHRYGAMSTSRRPVIPNVTLL